MKINIDRPMTEGQYVRGDCSYIDDFRTSKGSVFQLICTLDGETVKAMLKGQELPNKEYIALWIEDMFRMDVFGLYKHNDNTYLVKSSMLDLREVVMNNPLAFSDILKDVLNGKL